MNPYIIIAFGIALMGAGAGGFKLGIDHEQASQAREDSHIAEAVAAANTVAAKAISELRPKYTTIRQELEREIRTETVYADCRHGANGLRLVNQALNAGTVPVDSGKLPKTEPAK